ncbi:subtilisin-like protease [Dorcoceras hygrometricum]|uniref:Subtilisin-like protease n=1 Tax=Dorcoceras hygrometricum TaxID=472368 RepID=A0A2Z7C0U4_9LAMI|nr:subtilisin-like protease [Dorcoceras hygrometricum]
MSLFDLQDICIVIGSLATLDLPMVVDLIGIYVLKGPYYRSDQIVDRSYDEATVIGTNRMFTCWTGPAPSPMGRFKPITPIWSRVVLKHNSTHKTLSLHSAAPHLSSSPSAAPPSRAAAARCSRDWTCSDHVDEEIPSVENSSALLVQTDEGLVHLVMDRIKEIYHRLP